MVQCSKSDYKIKEQTRVQGELFLCERYNLEIQN